MSERLPAPCLHLGPAEGWSCQIGRSFPVECPGCSAYVAGITEEERQRCEMWHYLVIEQREPQ